MGWKKKISNKNIKICLNFKYGDLKSAVGHSDGLAVLGFFYEVKLEFSQSSKVKDKHPLVLFYYRSITY